MLSILPPLIRRSSGRPTKIRRKEPGEPQITTKLTKKRVQMKCSKYKKFGHNKRSCRREVGQNPLVTRHIVGVRNQHILPTHQEVALREKLPFKRKPAGQPITVRWMSSTQESSVSNPLMTPYGSSFSQY
ncbi:hypothetical protein Gogos_018043 [Gossypium gossypioides]|uniref:Uncharacterized protein n=1 Tax=Gossypium gossypioides TaxID=34282 RepID=A0A7J9BCP4_GOSGO|nr:hypothetical protein [Gossypium gossypioides]